MAPVSTRVQREQLRKRRNNLLRRHNDFWRLYGIKSWLVMESPEGQIFTYHSHPSIPSPSGKDMETRHKPKIARTPHDYDSAPSLDTLGGKVPALQIPIRRPALWRSLAWYLKKVA
ncbi:hypothetical protein N7478_010167 [Penicillium angulare]|uniref:uncharacterized protein n=1 Tax=Penicillium angulare TaxID=116970 RepID=UPI0025422F35|nr:uncharacterized protein N7478_010115 [Penicillium angulare]XP_056775751.1 uncharacterized protein N7478_010167 [Penicillium angulare]KAJ5267307.1 hypothetical protein N7478_010115 [Penicillium angulare]KAJ5267359.1 hypothetical protein N7478_010167 [Penicillium angulare]